MTLLHIAVMAGVTYLIRMLPMVLFRKKFNVHKLFLSIPYAVLGAMTFRQYCTHFLTLFGRAKLQWLLCWH